MDSLQLDTLLVGDASTEQRHATAHTFGTEAYASVTRRKASCVLAVLTRQQPPPALLFTDIDVTFFASPWAHLPLRTVDIALLDDAGPSQMSRNTLNSGFFFVRNLTSTCLTSLLCYAHTTDSSHRSAVTQKYVRCSGRRGNYSSGAQHAAAACAVAGAHLVQRCAARPP